MKSFSALFIFAILVGVGATGGSHAVELDLDPFPVGDGRELGEHLGSGFQPALGLAALAGPAEQGTEPEHRDRPFERQGHVVVGRWIRVYWRFAESIVFLKDPLILEMRRCFDGCVQLRMINTQLSESCG